MRIIKIVAAFFLFCVLASIPISLQPEVGGYLNALVATIAVMVVGLLIVVPVVLLLASASDH